MYGSGVVIGIAQAITVVHRRMILLVLLLALTVCLVAVAGPTMRRTVAVLIATPTLRPTGTTTSGSVSPCSKFFHKQEKSNQENKKNRKLLAFIPRRWRAEPPQAEE